MSPLRLSILAGLATAALLAGCAGAGPATPQGSTPDRVTASDEPEHTRRARVRLELASAYFGRGQTETALDQVKQAIAADPQMGPAHNLRGLIYSDLGDHVLAEESFRRALTLDRSDADAMQNYGWHLCQRQRYAEADQLFRQALEVPRYRNGARTLLTRGVCLARAGDMANAEAALQRAYELDPGSAAAGVNLSEVLYQRGQFERARNIMSRINGRSDVANAQTLWLGAKIEHKLGNARAARSMGDQLAARFPESPKAGSASGEGSMNEVNPTTGGDSPGPVGSGGRSAGRILREAREAQGIELDALASTMKVTPQKLEALESDRPGELPNPTFARALAQSICRTLKIDPAPVLEQLPRALGSRIEHVSEGLNEPFREHPSRFGSISLPISLRSLWAPAALLVLAAAIYFIPGGFISSTVTTVSGLVDAVRSGGKAGSTGTVALPPTEIIVQDGVVTVPAGDAARINPTAPIASTPAPAAPLSTAARGAGTVELRASADSWVEVKDGRNRTLLSRNLQPDETVMLDGVMPIRVKIGNAAVTELRYRGELIDLAPMTSENIARVQLK